MPPSEYSYQLYDQEPRGVLVERRWQCLRFTAQGDQVYGWHTTRYVFVSREHAQRGVRGSYPYLPKVEPMYVTREFFEEWWARAEE